MNNKDQMINFNEQLIEKLKEYGEKAPIVAMRDDAVYQITHLELLADPDGIPFCLAIVCGDKL